MNVRRLEVFFERINLFLFPVTGVLPKTRRLEVFLYRRKIIVFLYPVTGALFEDEVVGGNFYTGALFEEKSFLRGRCSFRKLGGWRFFVFTGVLFRKKNNQLRSYVYPVTVTSVFSNTRILFKYVEVGGTFIPKTIFCIHYWCSFRKRGGWRSFYTEENNLFLYPVTGALFEDEVVGGNFYIEENNLFSYPVTGVLFVDVEFGCSFRKLGGWRFCFYTQENNLVLYPVTGVLFKYVEVGGTFLCRRK
ncbi:hypothetical protein CEXT_288591 [Caerostris extrusa]|uniref:Uncharacterized protein n=1 Tax=Caerostris extrusa TaxID=172846 RepID=A0AAV4SWX3_CAEEX|nr:hypothetical protein CEXT_288591 [Caerostris extrusa]